MHERTTDHSLPIADAGDDCCGGSAGGCGCGGKATTESSPTKEFWRSLDDKNGTPEFRRWTDNEFQSGASELDGEDRRTFMKLMGASAALAGLAATGCRRLPEQNIYPYAHRPEGHIPGTVSRVATSWDFNGVGQGLMVRSFDFRPIKVDGNPNHPISRGGSDVFAQATILQFYDPDRSRVLMRRGAPSELAAFREWCAGLAGTGGKGLAILSEPSSSPSLADMRARLVKKHPSLKWFEWSAINDDAERAGTEIAFGQPMRPQWNFAKAEVVLSLDSNFLGAHPAAVKNQRDFIAARRIASADPKSQSMSRMYAAESALTLTGANADERIPIRSSDIPAFAAAVAARLGIEVPGAPAWDARKAGRAAEDDEVIEALVKDLGAMRGRSLVVAGQTQPPAVHALAALMNERLDNVGSTVMYVPVGERGRTALGDLRTLTDLLGRGEVSTLVIIGGNPAYDAPADLSFPTAMAKAPEVVHLSFHRNETSANPACTWHIPAAHYLESWGDARAWDGTLSPQQPLIEPLIAETQGGLSPIELLAEILDEDPRDGYTIVRRTWMAALKSEGVEFERTWRAALEQGVVPNSAWSPVAPTADGGRVAAAIAGVPAPAAGIEVTFAEDPKVFDGRFANVSWMQELPDPMSKITWDNAAYLSIGTAGRLGIRNGDMLSIRAGGRQMEAAAWLMPGMAEDSVRLNLGYGRGEIAGPIAKDAGFDAYAIRTSDAMGIATGASLERTGHTYPFAHTQDHGASGALVEAVPTDGIQKRLPQLVREASLTEYREHPDFAKHVTHVPHRLSPWHETNLEGAKFRWAMAIDLSACTGCSACVVACQAENNIPVVGKEQVIRGREMHWIRIDRYFKGSDPKRPRNVSIQPVTCMQCENAPCEQVCPVAATMHDKSGLNVMVYNRCIGTRYCSNNCPYKVRRFNFFDWQRKPPARETGIFVVNPDYYVTTGPNEWLRMQFNPEVTVRSRGVMEKCTFCVQRIQEAKIKTKNAWARAGGTASGASDWSIPDGTIVPACAEACPSEAIVFGDLNDQSSRVAKLQREPRAYELLGELNTKPRLRYLARVRNPAIDDGPSGHDGHDHDHDHDHAGATPAAANGEVIA